MSHAVHLITEEFPPRPGGLELWTKSFAHCLSKAGMRVAVYICSDQPAPAADGADYEIVSLAALRSVWEEPLSAPIGTERFMLERARLNFLILRNEIRRRAETSRARRQLLISTFSITVGHLATLVARDLAIPHVAMVVGTDFSRGFRNWRERPVIEYVCRNADAVVVRSAEQEKALTEELGIDRVVRIPASVDAPAMVVRRSTVPDRITLLSDCGFSFKKGTAVLLDSFESLMREGIPLRLVVYGDVAADQSTYWKRRQEAIMQRFSPHVEFPGSVTRETIYARLSSADIYCSATLGEGSSSARIAAICAGLPVVTTRCGEMESGMEGVSHVRLSNVADAADFLGQLRAMVQEVQQRSIRIDVGAIERWRERFSSEREMSAWAGVIGDVAPA